MSNHKQHVIELEPVSSRTAYRQVSNVDWVESTAENAYSCHAHDTFEAL